MMYFVKDDKDRFFHFWDRENYDWPQFGDIYWARRYLTLAGAMSRVRELKKLGLDVRAEPMHQAGNSNL